MARVLTFRDRALQSRDAVELIAQKWRITILHLLRSEPLRTSELQAAISEISPKVLTETLRGMERDGLISRKVHTVVPAHFEALDAGPLTQARVLEPFALLWISLALQYGYGREISFQLLRRKN
jgi:hypothetical protein